MSLSKYGKYWRTEKPQILKDTAAKVLHTICQGIWKTQQWPQDWKRSVFILIPKKGNAKKCSNYHTIALISHSSKVVLKILHDRLHQDVSWEIPDVQAGFIKGRGTSDQMPSSTGSQKKQENAIKKKPSISALLTMPKPFTVWITTNWKILKEMVTLPASWEICMQVRKQQLELAMEQQTASKLGKEYVKAIFCHFAYLPYMQNISSVVPSWMKHKLESRLLGEISIASDMRMTLRLWQKAKRNWRASWWKWKRRVKKLA